MLLQPAIASPSVGHQTIHPIMPRLEAVASHGFQLIELVEDDLAFYARDHLGEVTDSTKIQVATGIEIFCDRHNVKLFVSQPFWFYEGLLDREKHAARIAKLQLWMKLVKILGIQMIQIPTNWVREGTTGDMDVIVNDLTQMVEIRLEQDPPVSFAYEGVAWGYWGY